MIPRLRPFFGVSDIKAALFASNESLPNLENSMADRLGYKHALLLSLGRTAIYLYLRELNLKGRGVAIAVYNCRVVPATVVFAEAVPQYVDSAPDGFNVNCADIAGAVNGQTSAAILTSMYGYPFQHEEIKALKERFPSLPLIGDLALSIFSRENGYFFADDMEMNFFAFGIGKQVSIVEGGLLTTNNTQLYEKLKSARDELLQSPSLGMKLKRTLLFLGSTFMFHNLFYGALRFLSEETSMLSSMKGTDTAIAELMPKDWRYLPGPFQCGIGLNQLKKFDENRKRRAKITEIYFEELNSIQSERFKLPPYFKYLSHFPVLSTERDKLQEHLLKDGIHSTNVFRELPWDLPLVAEGCKGEFPRATSLRDRCTLLPLYAQLSDSSVRHVINSIKRWV